MLTTDLNKLAKEVYEITKSKGFWDTERNIGEIFLLIISEMGEALKAHRENLFADWDAFNALVKVNIKVKNEAPIKNAFQFLIKDTFEDEIADVVIGILDFAGHNKINIDLVNYQKKADYSYEDTNFGNMLMDININLVSAYRAATSFGFMEYDNYKKDIEWHINAALIRLVNLSTSKTRGFDLLKHVEAKMMYNKI